MIRKFILAGVLLLFTVSVTGLNHSEQSIESRMDVAPDLKSEMRSSIEVREKTNQARCSLRFHGEGTDHGWAGNVQASLSCPGDSESREGITARLATPDSSAPDEVLVVPNSELCNEDRVCYRMTSGTVDVNVVNDPPTVRGNPLYEDDGQTGENPLYETSMDSTAIIGFGSFSISKRSARTGRNPQTGKEIQSSGDESDRALANRMLASIKSSNCPVDGRERCVVEAVKNGEVYRDLENRGEIEILMTLTADPLVVPRSIEGSGDCDDRDPDVRPKLCGTTTHFLDPDSDGDGIDDLTMEQSGNLYEWKVNGEIVANATVHSARAADTQVFFLQADSLDLEVSSRAELVEAIASKSGLSKADSKKALDGFIESTLAVELDKSSPYIAKARNEPAEDLTNETSDKALDRATPELFESLERKDARIAELEARINELESRESMNSTRETTEGNDPVVRKKPGRSQGIDTDSDADGLSDGTEEQEVVEPVRRPGFVNRLVGSIFG